MTHPPEEIIARVLAQRRIDDPNVVGVQERAWATVIRRELHAAGWSIMPNKLAKAEKESKRCHGHHHG